VSPDRTSAVERSSEPEEKASEGLGPQLRQVRERAGITVREFARRVGVSPSLISQVERGLATPSVGTLLAITKELGLELGDLFRLEGQGDRAAPGPVQRGNARKEIRLASGVRWERLTPGPDPDVEFLYAVYDAGSASCEEDSMLRHGGKEYGYLLSGCLGVKIGFEEYELDPGDSISFDAHEPHRLWCIGSQPAVVIWAVVQRHGDARRAPGRIAGGG
jgi:transcriptional regulator with XRE-family HTH domain